MVKNSKCRLLFITVFLAVLLSYGANMTFVPAVQATEPTIQQKSLSVSSDVLGLNMTKYSVATQEVPDNLYRGVLPQETVRCYLEADESQLDVLYTFANGKLRQIHVLEAQGVPLMTDVVTEAIRVGNMTFHRYVFDEVENAKSFLNNYQRYSGKSLYGELSSMLNTVDATKNVTIASGNVKFEVASSDNSKTFRWTYTCNGIEAPDKCVVLGYKNVFLKYFIDNWDLYKVGSTSVNISEEQAIAIAIEHARAFSWKMGSDDNLFAVKGFTVANAMVWETIYCSNYYADKPRGGDLLTLYPVRHVWVSLDKFYPGNVYGINVYVWADTGEVCAINERVSTLDPPADSVATVDDFTVEALTDQALVDAAQPNGLSISLIAIPASAALFGAFPLWFVLSRRALRKRRSFMVGGVLLCLLVSLMLLVPISAANAAITRRALIWGAESTGDTSFWNGTQWVTGRKTANEINRQRITSNAIYNYFKDDHYTVNNYQGAGSIKYCILGNITDAETNYSKVAVVDFDHGVFRDDYILDSGTYHYMFEDNVGSMSGQPANGSDPNNWVNTHMVYDMDIYNKTAGKTFFAFINTCLSANLTYQDYNGGDVQGMPKAWTHQYVGPQLGSGTNLSKNGYTHPDSSAFCYMGFPWGSAALDQTITGISPIYATWVEKFFWYALGVDISINHALDEATLDHFGKLFGESDLAIGFNAIWPMWNTSTSKWDDPPYSGSTLVVYGNGNIHLYEYFVHDCVGVSSYGYYAGVTNPDGVEGGSNDNSYAYLYAVGWYGDQAVITGSIGWEAKGHIYLYGKTDQGYDSHVEVWVSYDYSNWYPVNENLWVSQSSPGWIDVGTYASDFRYIAITTYADQAPSTLYVDSVLVIPQPQQFSQHYWVTNVVSTTKYGDGSIANPDGLVHSYNDGSYVQLYGGNPNDGYEIVGAMNGDAHGHIYLWGYSAAGYYTHLYVYVAYNSGGPWYQPTIGVQTVNPGSAHWIDCGSYANNFRYIKIKAIDDNGMSANLFVDSVKVVP